MVFSVIGWIIFIPWTVRIAKKKNRNVWFWGAAAFFFYFFALFAVSFLGELEPGESNGKRGSIWLALSVGWMVTLSASGSYIETPEYGVLVGTLLTLTVVAATIEVKRLYAGRKGKQTIANLYRLKESV